MQERLARYCLEKGDRDCDGRSGAGEIASTIISQIEKGPDVTHCKRKTQAIWIQKIGRCLAKRFPPEIRLHSEEEGDMSPPKGWLEAFLRTIKFLNKS